MIGVWHTGTGHRPELSYDEARSCLVRASPFSDSNVTPTTHPVCVERALRSLRAALS